MSTEQRSISAGGVFGAGRSVATALREISPGGVVALTGVLLLAILAVRLSHAHGNVTAFIEFGRHFVPYTHPPHDAVIGSPSGYDGQFYWLQARDPLILHQSTLADISATGRGYDLQRMAYPALAALLAVGQPGAIPWTMLLVNVLAVLAVTGAVASYAHERGRSPWWGLVIGLTPGLVMGTLRDLSDPLATAVMLCGLVAYERRRYRSATVLLTLAVLAREPMIVVVAAVAVDLAWGLWKARSGTGSRAARRAVLRAWPVVLVPAVAFSGWQIYERGLTLATPASAPVAAHLASAPKTRAPVGSDTVNLPPFNDFWQEIQRSVHEDGWPATAWDVAYIALVLAAVVAAVAMLARGLLAPTLTALLSGAVISVLFLGDQWGVSRYGAPIFGAVLIAALRLGWRAPARLCAAVVLLTLLIPLVVAYE